MTDIDCHIKPLTLLKIQEKTIFFVTKIKNLFTVCGIMELLETINHIPKGDAIMIPQKQLTLTDIFEDCQGVFQSDKPQFLILIENHIDLDDIIPIFFISITMHTNLAL